MICKILQSISRAGLHMAIGLLFLTVAAEVASAQLAWDANDKPVTAKPAGTEVKAGFSFKNTGARPVAIRGVQTSCGCTTSDFKPKTYAPGESGEITLQFSVGGRIGEQKITANVLTDDPASNARLQLTVTIPQLYKLTPAVLYWKKGEALGDKSVTLEIDYPEPVKILSVSSSDPAIKATFETVTDGKSFRIVATPEPAPAENPAPMVKALLTIETDLPIPGKSSFMVYALVKR